MSHDDDAPGATLWRRQGWTDHSVLLLESFRRVVGRPLLDAVGDHADADARQLFLAPFVVVSHGVQADPILNYGNQAALDLWAIDPET
ncbi:MAG: MEKHLA domain-containing protein, partial [Planctomycetia bacterium]